MKFPLGSALIAALLLAAAPAAAAPATGLMDLVRDKYEVMLDTVRTNPDKEAMRASLRKVMDTFVDYDELGKRTLSGHWDKLKPKQRQSFVAEFKQMIQRTYIRRFDGDREFTIEYLNEPQVDPAGIAVVESIIRAGRSEARVDYAFHRKGKTWMAHDVVIDEVSMVRNYRKQFNDIIGKDGFDGLMARLVKRNKEQAE
ncbi:MAG TPA: ABC transporter substrate-binding protein [Myxococcota bacterium]|jgi:phospholipid transport system substrate-binding protein|nr:ABC transporter substrate-binding protein [Myxococcota bacterium]